MVLLDVLNPNLPPAVVRFVDGLIVLHVAALVYYLVTLAADIASGGKRARIGGAKAD